MLRRLALVAVPLLLALSACDTQSPLQEPALIPLEVGTAWVFEVERTYSATSITPANREPDTLRVIGTVEREGQTWAHLTASSSWLDTCMSGYYAIIGGEVWYTPNLETEAPYRLFAREAQYTVFGGFYDADVTLREDTERLTYEFAARRMRIPSQTNPAEFPVIPESPAFIHTLTPGSGFERYDQPAFSFSGPDSMRVFYIDTITRTDFLPAERAAE